MMDGSLEEAGAAAGEIAMAGFRLVLLPLCLRFGQSCLFVCQFNPARAISVAAA